MPITESQPPNEQELKELAAKFNVEGNRLIVLSVKRESVTESGIVIPDSAEEERPMKAYVVGVGTSERAKKFKIGDKVLCAKWRFEDFKFEDQDMKVLKLDKSDDNPNGEVYAKLNQ